MDWDKGCALTHLLGALGLGEGQGVLSLYLGDDRTDEDAFKALKGRPHGFGILVSAKVSCIYDSVHTCSLFASVPLTKQLYV